MIEEIVPGNRTRFNIIKTIYENPEINLTGLIKKLKISPNLALKYVNQLFSYHLIKEKRIVGSKKIHVRMLEPNFSNEFARNLYSLIEIDKGLLFFTKYNKLRSFFEDLSNIFEKKKVFVLVYGSYARFSASKDSDLDVLIVGKVSKEDVVRIRELFVTLDCELSLKIETSNKFLKNKDKSLYQNILKEHVVVYGVNYFMEVLSKISS